MRISERQRYKLTNTRVETSRSNNAGMMEKISTLKNINRISDDPLGTGKVIRYRDRISNVEQFQQNVEFSKGYLERTEAALQGINENLMRAQELAVNLSNATYDAPARLAAAKEVRQLMNEVISLGNTTFANRYVLSGYRVKTPALAPDGQYLGDDGALFLQTDDNDFRQINVQARYLFESSEDERAQGHFNMMDAMQILYDGLNENRVDGIRVGMNELNYQLDKCTGYQATIGALHRALQSSGQKLDGDFEQSKKEKALIEEVDMFKASSDFHRSEQVLQSTLLASNKMLQPSLLNFMQ